jgi:membrane protein required for colicin V production
LANAFPASELIRIFLRQFAKIAPFPQRALITASMNNADYVILGIIALSSLLSLKRGFTLEAVSLATWVAAFVLASLFSVPLAVVLADQIETPSLRQPAAFLLLFIGTLIVGALLKRLFKELVRSSGLSAADRVLGVGFGVARGLILVVVALSFMKDFKKLEFSKDPWWQQSLLIPHMLTVENWTSAQGKAIWHALKGVCNE